MTKLALRRPDPAWPLLLLLLYLLSGASIASAGSKDQRIVDADQVSPVNRFTFLAIFNFQRTNIAKCTASLISEFWVLSAAHCIGKKSQISVDDCGSSLTPPIPLRCKSMANGDLQIVPLSHPDQPQVLLGVYDLQAELNQLQPILVDHIIRPKEAYPGGNYGTYGGYDIILVKLKESASSKFGDRVRPIALPADDAFHDLGKATIAGYGRFRRATCQTNAHGPGKYEYCGTAPHCTEANCTIQFMYKGRQVSGCSYSKTPSHDSPVCRALMKDFDFSSDTSEVVIVDTAGQLVTKCYRTSAGSYGWCGTITNYWATSNDQGVDVQSDSGWGFCSKSCYPDMDVSLGGIARFMRVDVISKETCDKLLLSELGDPPPVEYQVPPKVVCVALKKKYNTVFYQMMSRHVFQPVQPDRSLLNRTSDFFITGTGSCTGDSGGPLFKTFKSGTRSSGKSTKHFVLIGSTSRGSGYRGNCGGLNNPTHYVRVKKFLHWIKLVVGKEHLFFSQPDWQEEETL